MNRIQKVSTYLLTVLKGLIIALPIFIIFNWTVVGTAFSDNPFWAAVSMNDNFISPEGLVTLHTVAWTGFSRTLGMIADMIGTLPIFIGLFALIHIFKNYQRNDIFSISNAKYYRLLGWLFFLDAFISQPIRQMMMSLAVTLSNPPGHRYISVGFGTPNMEAIFCGAVLIVVSWVMLEASKLHDEQKYTV